MTMKLTDRDKKLLVILAVFVLIVGVGAGIIYPLLHKNEELQTQLAEARLVKMENEQKVVSVANLKSQKEKAAQSLSEVQSEFFAVMASKDIDKMMTEMALSYGLVARDLNISMPGAGEYTSLTEYPVILSQGASAESENGTPETPAYGGIYTARIDFTMTGSRGALQEMLNACMAMEPKLRVSEFLWSQGRGEESENDTLAISAELYMYETTEQYQAGQMMQELLSEEGTGDVGAAAGEDAETIAE